MYTLFDTRSMWPTSGAPANQIYYKAVPATPIMVNTTPCASTSAPQPCYYPVQPTWYAPAPQTMATRARADSDDVFVPDSAFIYEAPIYDYNFMVATPIPENAKTYDEVFAQPLTVPQNVYTTQQLNVGQVSDNVSLPLSKSYDSCYNTQSEHYSTPKKLAHASVNSSDISSNSNSSSPKSHKTDDSMINNLFPASLCAALNEDPPEPAKKDAPLKTSSPIHNNSGDYNMNPHAEVFKLGKRRGRVITSAGSEKCLRFSENGVSDELDQCDRILLQFRKDNAAEEQAKRREEFLLILEAERERQRKLALPKNTPKMNCKFCKNNGELPEVYTKHRLHYNEKTVCPLLRHYVCRLCNSTGDFAHTIRHCPFNDRKDKIAWKATFLA